MSTRELQASGVQYTDRRDFYIDPTTYAELWPSVTPFTTEMQMKRSHLGGDSISTTTDLL
jgi:hypothetical protein